MLVVFDTNVLEGDMRADRSRLRAILDDRLPNGTFELFVPAVVVAEADKRFAQRRKRVVKAVNKALGEHAVTLREIGLAGPKLMQHDQDDVAGYRAALEARLTGAGVSLLPVPSDLSPALDWAIRRRKPFKQSGEGFPDAAIWLTVLKLAAEREEPVVFVSANTRDFGGDAPGGLAQELSDDLVEHGLGRERVRLVAGIHAFSREIAARGDDVRERARRLARDGSFDSAIEETALYSRVAQRSLELHVPLDEDPQIVGLDLDSLRVEDAVELRGDRLLIDATAVAQIDLELLIHKADWTAADDDVHVKVVGEFNERYVSAESEAEVRLRLRLVTDIDAATDHTEVEIVHVELTPEERVRRALKGRDREVLLKAARAELPGAIVGGYVTDLPLESDIDQADVVSIPANATFKLSELIESDGFEHACRLEFGFTADVEWSVFQPTPFDGDAFAAYDTSGDSGAPVLQDVEPSCSLVAELTASWDVEHSWHSVKVEAVRLVADVERERSERTSRAEDALFDLVDPADEDAAGA